MASMSVLIFTVIFEISSITQAETEETFISAIPAIIIAVYLVGRNAAIVATLVAAAAGLAAARILRGQVPAEDWLRAIFLLVSGFMIALVFHRLRQDVSRALEIAENRLSAVEATESRFRSVFERAAIGFANTNEKGELLQSNRRLCELTGYSEAELAHVPLERLVHPDDRAGVVEALADQGRSGTPFDAEVRLLKKDGSPFWARLNLSSYRSDGPLSESAVVVVDDISERRAAREAMRIQKERLDLALSAGRLGTWQIDLQSEVVTGSDKFWEILGLPGATSRPMDELAAVIYAADWRKLAVPKASGPTTNYDVEVRARRSDGTVRWVALRGREEQYNDQQLLIGVAADLTERRQTTLLRATVRRRERILIEQRHRFSNLFSVVTALVKMVEVPGNSVTKFKEDLVDRIRALEITHTMISRRTASPILLQDLVVQELLPYLKTRTIRTHGPDVVMSSGAAETFAMIVHELTTNSVKHGVLGGSRGRLEVRWAYALDSDSEASADVVFDWIESGSRRKAKNIGHGMGSMILGVNTAPLIGHSSKLEIFAGGLRYSLRLPRREIES
ncbi:PAS domain S-box protein [Mesorhizobium sp. B4-1-3]|uniref:PAS domain S-box protein n=1 Tax=Mesorhizobium sp. B4-1-3 TaxID=2589889 RepID=UPI001FEF7837|nr:PAS domain S-box protein [Mesorhizobium sp. B4-1-3]